MPKAFETWTVLPHEPVQKHSENLWSVRGTLPDGKTDRVMTVAKLADGRLVIHNAVALEDPLMSELEAFGQPAALVVPNGYHRLDAKIWKQRYPAMKVYCPLGCKKRVSQVVPVDGGYEDAPADDTVRLTTLDGVKANEGVLEVRSRSGRSLVFNDAICNLPKLGFPMGFMLHPTGRPSTPRLLRWLVANDKKALAAHFDKLASDDAPQRIIVSHGRPITEGTADTLRSVAAELRG